MAEVTPRGEEVLRENPKLGVSARIVEDYARSDGKHFTAAIQHVLGTLDPRIPGLGAWEAIEAASPVPDTVIDLSGESFAGEVDLAWIPDPAQAQWAAIDAKGGKSLPDAPAGSDEDKARLAHRVREEGHRHGQPPARGPAPGQGQPP